MRKQEYPYQNRSLTNIKGEKWKPIPDMDELFWISNYGRIKALSRYILRKTAAKGFWTKERIVPSQVQKTLNHFTGDFMYQLYAGAQIEGNRHRFNIRRLVYHLFVSPLPSNPPRNEVIAMKDDNGLNCKASNLKLISVSQRQQRIFIRHRTESTFKKLTAIQRREMARKNQSLKLVVKQFGIDGKLLKVFDSITEAAKATGTNITSISLVASGKMRSANGFVWRYKKGNYKGELAKLPAFKKVIQYALDGKIINSYKTIKEAAGANKFNAGNIGAALNGIRKHANGFVWRYEDRSYNGELAGIRTKHERKIEQLTLSGKRIEVYSTIKEAAHQTRIHNTSITQAARGRKKHAGNFMWKYAD